MSTAPLGPAPCYVPLPAGWKKALAAGELWHGVADAHGTGVPLGDGSGVLLQNDVGSGSSRTAHFTIVGRDHRTVLDLGSIPAPSSTAQWSFDAASADAVAFTFHPDNGPLAAWTWKLYLWTPSSGRLKVIASNPTDSHGNPLSGGWVTPVLSGQYLYWITASADVKGWGGSSLMQYNLDTGRTRRLYTGLTEAFVPYRNLVLFTAIDPDAPPASSDNTGNGTPEHLQAVDATTGAPAIAPAGITAPADGANNIITDGDIVIWNTWQGGLRAWKQSWGRSITLIPDLGWDLGAKLELGSAAMPRLYGHFVIFNPSDTYVLDLDTDSFAQVVNTPDSEEVTGPWLAVQAYTTQTSYDRATNVGTYDQYLINLARLPGLAACPGRGGG